MNMLPQLHRHAWMDEDIEAFRDQARRYIERELVPHMDAWRRQGFIPREVWRPFKSGDLGRSDQDGWLWFMGRAAHKQLIKTGGENVYPAEVEQVLLEHPAVAEALVFGRPDAHWGEGVHAACVLKQGAVANEGDLIRFIETRLARYKRPQSIQILNSLADRVV